MKLADLGLQPSDTIAYVFDFGDNWQVLLTVLASGPADKGRYPRVVASQGEAPPQYEYDDDEEDDEESP